jgi:uncharacterized membrane protein
VTGAAQFPNRLAARRVVQAAAAGAVALGVAAFLAPWQAAVTMGWSVAAAVYLGQVWARLRGHDAEATAAHATRLDDSRVAADLFLLAACLGSLVAMVTLLVKAQQSSGGAKAGLTGLAIGCVVLSWSVVHTVFALRYAHAYYAERGPGGIDFNGDDDPNYVDFAYVAFTIGMTYQVSDTDLTAPFIRALALRHALLSFLFGTAIIAVAINVVAGLIR